jgi:hypothetical protein
VLACTYCFNTDQETCIAAQDACSITVTVFCYPKFSRFRLVIGSSVPHLEHSIIAKGVFKGVLGERRYLRPSWTLYLRNPFRNSFSNLPVSLQHICSQGEEFTIDSPPQRCGLKPGQGLGKGDIGVFVASSELVSNRNMPTAPAAQCPGTHWLIHPQPPSFAHPDDVSAVAHACGGSNSADSIPACEKLAAVAPDACQTLRLLVARAHAEAAAAGSFVPQPPIGQGDGLNSTQMHVALGSCETDFKMLLSPDQLLNIIGADAYLDILAALQVSVPDAIVLRRTVATGRFIAFHTDHAARTVQVPLNHDSSCVGGRLLFARTDGKLLMARRREGCILVHDGDVAHGVTRLIKGIRFGLFALRSRCDDC